MGTLGLRSENLAETTGAVSWLIDFHDDIKPELLTLKIDTAPTSAGLITVTLDSQFGSGFDTILRTIDPVATSATDISIENLPAINKDDRLVVAYANPDGRTITGQITVDLSE